jgi:group I intron endonuclease
MTFHFYKITNTVNGKSYIGYTGKLHPRNRWIEHVSQAKAGEGSVLHAAIRKYGKEPFVFEVISKLEGTSDDAIAYEATMILENKTLITEGGYNVLATGSIWSEKQKRAHAEATKAGMTLEVRQHLSESLKSYYATGGVHAMKGKTHSEESKQKMSTTHQQMTEETRKKIGQASKEMWADPEARQKVIRHLQHPSDETRQKMSAAKKGKSPWNKGRRSKV